MVFELFSKRRQKAELSESEDIYQYNDAPRTLRVQLQQIFTDAIGPQYWVPDDVFTAPHHNEECWSHIKKILCRELGIHSLTPDRLEKDQILNYVGSSDLDGFLDAVELCVRMIARVILPLDTYERGNRGITQDSAAALDEINYRFREAKLGYQFENGEIFRVDSQFIHQEITKPALNLLRDERFKGAQEEFLQAHSEYRSGNYSNSITLANSAFESTLKIVCTINGWEYQKGARASDLLKTVRKNGLWPDYLDGSFDQLAATLASGLPKVRGEAGAHGQGPELRNTPAYVASYALHLAAAKIVLICEAQRGLRSQ